MAGNTNCFIKKSSGGSSLAGKILVLSEFSEFLSLSCLKLKKLFLHIPTKCYKFFNVYVTGNTLNLSKLVYTTQN